jgi:hypothetical protein
MTMQSQHGLEIGPVKNIGVKDPEEIFVFDPFAVRTQRARAPQQLLFFRYLHAHIFLPALIEELSHHIRVGVEIDQNINDPESLA